HRPRGARAGRPVQLPDVVVRDVLAHRLELGAEPDRAADAQADLLQVAAADGCREPEGARQVWVDEHLAVGARAVVPGAEAERADGAHGRGGEDMAAAAPCGDARVEAAARLRRLDVDVGRARL